MSCGERRAAQSCFGTTPPPTSAAGGASRGSTRPADNGTTTRGAHKGTDNIRVEIHA